MGHYVNKVLANMFDASSPPTGEVLSSLAAISATAGDNTLSCYSAEVLGEMADIDTVILNVGQTNRGR